MEVKKEHYYWCSSCNVPIKEGESSHEKHDTHDMETEDGREMAEIHLKTLLVTCKSTWNGSLSKHREVGTTIYFFPFLINFICGCSLNRL